MAEGAGAGLMQQSGQDLASWKCFSYIYCARSGKSWLCRTYRAHRVEKDTFLEVSRFEEGRVPQTTRWQDVRRWQTKRNSGSKRSWSVIDRKRVLVTNVATQQRLDTHQAESEITNGLHDTLTCCHAHYTILGFVTWLPTGEYFLMKKLTNDSHPFSSLSQVRVGLSRNGLPASRFRDKWQIWDGKRKICFSPSRIVTFLPFQKNLYLRGQKVTFFGKDVTKNVTSSKKCFRVQDRHVLPRKVTKVTRHIFSHRKRWQKWRHSPKSETWTWEEIGLRPTLSMPHFFE